jgi:hypothetical protein
MVSLSNSSTVLLEAVLNQKGAQVFGSWFQDAVAHALGTIAVYQGCYMNKGAGQPDIISGRTGFEVKSIANGTVAIDGNYQAIRSQYAHFKLVGLRTDVKPFPLWVLEMPLNPPESVTFRRIMDARTPVDEELNRELASRLSIVLAAAGTSWTNALDRDAGCSALRRAAESARWLACAGAT